MIQVLKYLFLLIKWCPGILKTFYYPTRSGRGSAHICRSKDFCILICLLFMGMTNLHAQKTVRIGIITDGDYWENPLILKSIKDELSILSADRYRIEYPPDSQLNGNFDNALIQRQTQLLSEQDNLDVIIALGNLSAKHFVNQEGLKTPVVTPYVDFPFLLGFLDEKTLSPKNPSWTTTFDPALQASIFVTLKKIFEFKSMTLICSNQLCGNKNLPPVLADKKSLFVGRFISKDAPVSVRAIPSLETPVVFTLPPDIAHSFLGQTGQWLRVPQGWILKSDVKIRKNEPSLVASKAGSNTLIELLNHISSNAGLNSKVVTISPGEFRDALKGIDSDIALVGNLYGFSEEQVSEVYSFLKEIKTPSVTLHGQKGIEQGALIAVTQRSYQEIGKTNAVKINMFANGLLPSDIPVLDILKINLTFNLDTAKAIDFDIPIQQFYESRLYEKKRKKTGMTLAEAIERALKENHQVTVLQEQLHQANSKVDTVISSYKPQISSKIIYSQMDATRADIYPSPQAQTKAELSLTQTIWNPEIYGMLDQAEIGRDLLLDNRDIQIKNIEERVIRSYLNILMSQEIVSSRKKHLLINKKLGEIANVRFNLKATGKTDVLRTEISYENAQLDMADAIGNLSKALEDFRNLLNLPQHTEINLDPQAFSQQKEMPNPFSRYRTVTELNVLEDFLLEWTLEVSRELKLIKGQVKQASLEEKQIDRKYQAKIQSGVTWFHQLSDEHRDISSSVAEENYEKQNTTGWNVQISLSYPIFNGGRHSSEMKTARFRTLELIAEQKRQESNILSNGHNIINAFYTNQRKLELTKNKLRSTKESYDLGYESYKEGAITMMELLDFQSMVFLTEIGTTVARYKVIQSLVDVLKLIDKLNMLHESKEEILKYSNQIHQKISQRIKSR
ncbi:MAG: TolC family protein [Proteobacteria bacterium]|nr:TolC family protein [Pseudomonadota bacterium]